MSIHVFDLDDTLIFHDYMRLNHELVGLLYELVKKRDEKNGVKAILLLTNNGDSDFIRLINDIITDEIYGTNGKKSKQKLFDYILWRYHPARNGTKENPTKSMDDVKYMMNEIGIPFSEDTQIYFYDDLEGHVLQSEIPKSNFIHVKPYNTDLTRVLHNLKGGGKKRKQRKTKKTKKKRGV